MFDARAELSTTGAVTYWASESEEPTTQQHESVAAARTALIYLVRETLEARSQEALHLFVSDPEAGPSGLRITQGGVEPVPLPPAPQSDVPEDETTLRSELDKPAVTEAAPRWAPTPPPAPQAPLPLATGRRAATEPAAAPQAGTLAASFSGSAKPRPEGPAQEGWQGGLNRLSGGAFKLAPGTAERRRRLARAAVQRGLDGHKTVAFVNIKGGATKTTATYLTAAIFGTVRGGSVLAWDANENKGTLGDRAIESAHDRTAVDLLADLGKFQAGGHQHELVQYMRPQGELRFDVLASQNTAGTSSVIDAEGYRAMRETLRAFYRMIFVDTGNSPSGLTWEAVVDSADLLVICANNKEDQVKVAASTIDTLTVSGYGEKVANAVFLVSNPQRRNKERLDRMRKTVGDSVRAVVEVPFDPELDDGARIDWSRLHPSTREAYLMAGQAVAEGL